MMLVRLQLNLPIIRNSPVSNLYLITTIAHSWSLIHFCRISFLYRFFSKKNWFALKNGKSWKKRKNSINLIFIYTFNIFFFLFSSNSFNFFVKVNFSWKIRFDLKKSKKESFRFEKISNQLFVYCFEGGLCQTFFLTF